MTRKSIFNKCVCGRKKQTTSATCRKCYLKTANRIAYKKTLCSCGNAKSDNKAKNCLSCYRKIHSDKAANKTIGYYWDKYKGGPNAYVHIRVNARAYMNRLGIPKRCKICSYSKHVEVCHIKGISEFSKDTKIKVVNSKQNMVYLCPNHHWEYDKGLLDNDSL